MSYAPLHLHTDHTRPTAARLGGWIDNLVGRVLGPPSVKRIAADIRSGHIERYVEPGVRQVYMDDGKVYEATAADGWEPHLVR